MINGRRQVAYLSNTAVETKRSWKKQRSLTQLATEDAKIFDNHNTATASSTRAVGWASRRIVLVPEIKCNNLEGVERIKQRVAGRWKTNTRSASTLNDL